MARINNPQPDRETTLSYIKVAYFITRIFPFFLTVYILFRISLNLFNDSPWYDEAMQFWISFGSNPDSLNLNGGIWEVVKLNQLFNHDPGGFSIILHLWLKFSQDLCWIRILPLLFFLASVFTTFLTVHFVFKNKFLSFICALIPFLSDTLIYFSTEIRAYSMECLCCSFGILAICETQKQKSLLQILGYTLVICLLATSRYSAMVLGALVILVISLSWFRNQKHGAVCRVLVMIVPFLLFATMTYLYSLSLQNPFVKTPSYVDLSVEINFFNIIIFLTPPACLVLFSRSKDRRLFTISLFVTLLNFTFLILALLEIHPADIKSKYCIGMLWGNLSFFIIILAKFLSSVSHHLGSSMAICIVGIGILLQHNSLSMRANQNFFDAEELCKLYDKKIYVDRGLSPIVKYLTTFGVAKKCEVTNKNDFFYQKQTTHALDSDGNFLGMSEQKSQDFSPFDVLIVSDSIINDESSNWENTSNHFYHQN